MSVGRWKHGQRDRGFQSMDSRAKLAFSKAQLDVFVSHERSKMGNQGQKM